MEELNALAALYPHDNGTFLPPMEELNQR